MIRKKRSSTSWFKWYLKGVTRDTVVNTLKEVGFDDEKMAATIQSLSGGWRMKLAIARAMLWDADVLLLDEPTNHLDTSAIAWLTNYLKSLTNTTICLVSHDYDFLAEVLTDVIHLSEKTLTYYPMSFRDFQSLKPEIVAALPSSDNAIAKQSNIEGSSADGAKEAKKESRLCHRPNRRRPAVAHQTDSIPRTG